MVADTLQQMRARRAEKEANEIVRETSPPSLGGLPSSISPDCPQRRWPRLLGIIVPLIIHSIPDFCQCQMQAQARRVWPDKRVGNPSCQERHMFVHPIVDLFDVLNLRQNTFDQPKKLRANILKAKTTEHLAEKQARAVGTNTRMPDRCASVTAR